MSLEHRSRAWREMMSVPAWKSLPSWFMIAEADEVIPPVAERSFAQRKGATAIGVASSQVAMVSRPDEVADLIETALKGIEAQGLRAARKPRG